MDCGEPGEWPAFRRFGCDARDFRLGHAGVVLKFKGRKGSGLVAAEPGESDDRADIRGGLA